MLVWGTPISIEGELKLEKYVKMAKQLGAENALMISSKDVCFDRRVILKCLWGCDYNPQTEATKCGPRGLGFEESKEAIEAYQHILLVHNHDDVAMSRMVLKLERQAFLDGYYLAFALRACHVCRNCSVHDQGDCKMPEKIRPCETAFGIDVYKTVRDQGLPCQPLQTKDDQQNRYGFVLID